MKTQPIAPAQVVFDHPAHPGLAYAPAFGDIYHARAGAHEQARHVFLAGNGLPGRWQGRERFAILETGFGLGNNFLCSWQAWQDDPQRCQRLVYLAIEQHPPSVELLRQAHANSPTPELARALCEQWPPATPDLHTLSLDEDRVTLMLAWGEAALWLPQLQGRIDAFFLDGFAPARNPAMWDARLLKSCARLAAPQARLATWSVARPVREAVAAAGFQWERAAGFGTKRDMLIGRWQGLGPGQRQIAAPPGRAPAERPRSAIVIGAGLAGAAAAWALARQGLAVQVLERAIAAASRTSGNTAGLFHGVVHAQDGAHAQMLRAAALRAQQVFAPLIASGAVIGQINGLLRGWRSGDEPGDIETPANPSQSTGADLVDAMQAQLNAQALPPRYAQALDASVAQAAAGGADVGPAWLMPGGGWLNPPSLVKAWMATPGVSLKTCTPVFSLARSSQGQWQALDAGGEVLAQADVIVLAQAQDSASLLGAWTDVDDWPLEISRGQVSQWAPSVTQSLGLPALRIPVAGGGYAISLPASLGGGVLFGATQQPGDTDAALRESDHVANLAQLSRLMARPDLAQPQAREAPWTGRVGWRLSTPDRMPFFGPVPLPRAGLAGAQRLEQARFVPRIPGLYLLAGLGSRGITLAPWLGELLAQWIVGAPLAVSSDLLDAMDVGRFVARRYRAAS